MPVHGHFSSIPGSGPSAALRLAAASCRLLVFALGPSTALRTGFVAGGRTRQQRAGRWPIVRLLHRTMFLEVAEDGADDCGVFDACHDPHRAAAVDAGVHVEV